MSGHECLLRVQGCMECKDKCIVFRISLVALVHIQIVALIYNNRYNQ